MTNLLHAAPNLPLLGRCGGCGAPHAMLQLRPPYNPDYLCPKCAQQYAVESAARKQLEQHVRAVVSAWVDAWGNIPGIVDLDEQLHMIGLDLMDEYKGGMFNPST